jgi:flagellar basal-body rod modification protein FlgD
MDISGLSTVASQSELTVTETKKNDVLGKDDFLRLLVTQLQYQDPLNPADSAQFTAQLAQFSSLEQLGNINDNIGGLQLSQTALNNSQAVNFIGKTVTSSGNSIHLTDGVSDDLQFELGADAKAVFMSIYDAAGNYVKTIGSGALSAGEQTLKWDGADQAGNRVSDGAYTFEVAAVDADGNMVNTKTFTSGMVTGVTFKNGSLCLLAGNKEIPVDTVIQITEDGGIRD